MKYDIYTDGSCKGNPGPGGVGAAVYLDGVLKDTLSKGYYMTTNNRMEMMAVVFILEKYGKEEDVTVWTDSQYVKRGITEWLSGWKANDWMRVERGKKVNLKNSDLWKKLDSLLVGSVKFEWVKGHSNEEGNETADRLAVMASSRGPFVDDSGFNAYS